MNQKNFNIGGEMGKLVNLDLRAQGDGWINKPISQEVDPEFVIPAYDLSDIKRLFARAICEQFGYMDIDFSSIFAEIVCGTVMLMWRLDVHGLPNADIFAFYDKASQKVKIHHSSLTLFNRAA